MHKIKNIIDKIIEKIVIFLMAVNVINVLWQVFSRFILNNPSSFTEELSRYLLIWLGLIGAAYASGKNAHLSIDLLREKLSVKSRAVLSILLTSAIFLFIFTVFVWGGIRLVHTTLILNQISAALKIKMGHIYLALPLSGFIFIFYCIVQIAQHVKTLRIHACDEKDSLEKNGRF